MPVISVRIPQLGEGLQEALLIEFLKKPGDSVKRDEPIYTMETDKAVTEVESPYEGTMVEWTETEDSVLPIGSEIGKMEVAEGVEEIPMEHGAAPTSSSTLAPRPASKSSPPKSSSSDRKVPPRTKNYLKKLGLLEIIDQIPSKTNKLMPEDVDAYLAAGGAEGESGSVEFTESELPKQQQTLNYRMSRGAQACIPVVISNEVEWGAIQTTHTQLKDQQGDAAPSAFLLLLWAVVQTMKDHPGFRSALSADGNTLRTYKNATIGIAVAIPGDVLVTAVVPNADTLSFEEFVKTAKERIAEARTGKDQATAATTLSVSNMGSVGVRMGIPVVVAPAVATMTLGKIYDHPVPQGDGFAFKKFVNVTIAIDHRIVNGAGAAQFLNALQQNIENFSL